MVLLLFGALQKSHVINGTVSCVAMSILLSLMGTGFRPHRNSNR